MDGAAPLGRVRQRPDPSAASAPSEDCTLQPTYPDSRAPLLVIRVVAHARTRFVAAFESPLACRSRAREADAKSTLSARRPWPSHCPCARVFRRPRRLDAHLDGPEHAAARGEAGRHPRSSSDHRGLAQLGERPSAAIDHARCAGVRSHPRDGVGHVLRVSGKLVLRQGHALAGDRETGTRRIPRRERPSRPRPRASGFSGRAAERRGSQARCAAAPRPAHPARHLRKRCRPR
jgi:hypothetical protein